MSGSCRFEGCTIDQTGSCALERDPASCANRIIQEIGTAATIDARRLDEVGAGPGDGTGAPVLAPPNRAIAFPSSRALGLEDLNTLMRTRYVNVVGILGDPESGKTACLASLYLLISHAALEGWTYADSTSLSAFEDIARGARDWNNGNAPEQMTVHTELAKEHGPGFLHLRLIRSSDGRQVDFALPDLPGEWTQALVHTGRSDRMEFLNAAEAIWIVLDGRTLADVEKRHGLIARAGQLANRVQTLLNGRVARVILVITHRDIQPVDEIVAQRLRTEFARRATPVEIVGVAPFSDNPDQVPAGFGLAELIDLTVGIPPRRPTFWAPKEPAENQRSYLGYRRDR